MKMDKMTMTAILLMVLSFIYSWQHSLSALNHATFQFVEMLKVVPPIFLMIGLLDVWVP